MKAYSNTSCANRTVVTRTVLVTAKLEFSIQYAQCYMERSILIILVLRVEPNVCIAITTLRLFFQRVVDNSAQIAVCADKI